MKVKQIADFINQMAGEMNGETELVSEDLSNVVDIGQTLINSMGYEQFTNTLVDKIGRVIMVNREYETTAPDILRRGTGIPYGSVTEKVRVKLPPATYNESWPRGETWTAGQGWTDETNPTNDNANPFITVRPEVEVTYFNGHGTYEIDMTYPRFQNNSGFNSAADYRRFADTVENRIFQSKEVFREGLTMRVINNLIGEKIANNNAVYDLLASYNAVHTSQLTAAQAIYNPDFLRYAGYIITLYSKRLRRMSRMFNASGYDTFTPADRLRMVMLDSFSDAVTTFMESDTFHNELVGLPAGAFSTVSYWQGSGTNYAFADAAALNITTASGTAINTKTGTVGEDGGDPFYILGCMFDVEAAWNDFTYSRTTSQWNARKEQTTYFYKEDVDFCNDLAENAVVFTIGKGAVTA